MILELIGEAETPAGFTIFGMTGVRGFLDGLTGREEESVIALLEFVVKHGIPRIKMKSNALGHALFELKAGPVRLPFFYDKGRRRVIIVTHYFYKDSQQTPPNEIHHARQQQSLIERLRSERKLIYENMASEKN